MSCIKNFSTLEEFDGFVVCSLNIIQGDLQFWYAINIVLQLSIIILSIVATLCIALQTEVNKMWVKPIGIVATVLIGGATTATNVFHVRETIDQLITGISDMTKLVNITDLESKHHPEKTEEIIHDAADKLATINDARLRAFGSIGYIGTRSPGLSDKGENPGGSVSGPR
jgi:hypothetical protein